MSKDFYFSSRSFTLVELMVSLGIFTFMTVLMVTKYGNFNQSILLTDLAYDVALTIRTAQTYGLSVKNVGGATTFNYSYGIDFSNGASSLNNNRQVIFFADSNPNNYYDVGDTVISTYAIKRGAYVYSICVGSGQASCSALTSNSQLDISFKRPSPNAIICPNNSCIGDTYAEIILRGTDGSTRMVVARENGQISVGE